jgi:hypothetical protein
MSNNKSQAETSMKSQGNIINNRVWCPIDELWREFPERLVWMAEPCRAIAAQLGFPIRSV